MQEFFINIGSSIAKWFVEDMGWAAILGALAIIILGIFAIKIICTIIRRVLGRTKLHRLTTDFLMTVIKILLYFVYVVAIMKVLGIDTSGVVAILAAVSLAVSLALQTVLSNFASGMIIIGNHPFKEGDYVETSGISGTVENVSLFNTRLRTPDNKIITVPNSSITGSNIINYSAMEKRRVDLTFGVAYGTDIDRVKSVMCDELDRHELVLHEDGYTVRLYDRADRALVFVCRCWARSSDYWTVFFDINENMTKRFKAEGIEIPYNKLDVNIVEKKN